MHTPRLGDQDNWIANLIIVPCRSITIIYDDAISYIPKRVFRPIPIFQRKKKFSLQTSSGKNQITMPLQHCWLLPWFFFLVNLRDVTTRLVSFLMAVFPSMKFLFFSLFLTNLHRASLRRLSSWPPINWQLYLVKFTSPYLQTNSV